MRSITGILTFIVAMTPACALRPETSIPRSGQVTSNQGRTETKEPTLDQNPLTPLPQKPEQLKASNIEFYGSALLNRNSTTKNDSGRMIPPYYSAEISGGLNKEPHVGDDVAIIPLIEGIEPFFLAIRSAEMKSEACSDGEYWEVKFDPIKSRKVLDAKPREGRADEYPFDIFLIYPAVDFAKNIAATDLQTKDLPNGIVPIVVHVAIDIDADGKPDLLEVHYCCGKPRKPAAECDLTCTKMYRKFAGKWKLTDEDQPC